MIGSFSKPIRTDIGYCRTIKPRMFQLNHHGKDKVKTIEKTCSVHFCLSQGTKVGKMNGISLLLDAETFDYAYPIEVKLHNFSTQILIWE